MHRKAVGRKSLLQTMASLWQRHHLVKVIANSIIIMVAALSLVHQPKNQPSRLYPINTSPMRTWFAASCVYEMLADPLVLTATGHHANLNYVAVHHILTLAWSLRRDVSTPAIFAVSTARLLLYASVLAKGARPASTIAAVLQFAYLLIEPLIFRTASWTLVCQALFVFSLALARLWTAARRVNGLLLVVIDEREPCGRRLVPVVLDGAFCRENFRGSNC